MGRLRLVVPGAAWLLAGLAACGAPLPQTLDEAVDAGQAEVLDAGVADEADASVQPASDAGDGLDGGAPDSGRVDAGGADGGPLDAGAPDAGPPRLPVEVTFSCGELMPLFNQRTTTYSLSSYTRLEPVTVTVRNAERASFGTIPLRDGVPFTLPAQPIAPGASVALRINDIVYNFRTRPADLASITVVVNNPAPGALFLTNGPYILQTDELGELQFYRRVGGQPLDFKRQTLPDGGVRHTYNAETEAVVLDRLMQPVATHRVLPTPGHPDYPPDQHEFKLLDDGHALLFAQVDTLVTNIPAELSPRDGGVRVVANLVQESLNGSVVFEWNSVDHPELYALATESNTYGAGQVVPLDYAHLNSIEVDPADGHLLLSFRHLDAVLKVHRTTGDILWRLGGADDSFNTDPGWRPIHQHTAVMIGPQTLQLYDNRTISAKSRVGIYKLDADAGAITAFESVALAGFSAFMGSAQRVNSTTLLIGYGSHGPTAPDVQELDLSTTPPTQTFRLVFGSGTTYRAYKAP